ncbi:MAG: LUD domain-containing protein [Pseudomonadota bacterium]
MAQDTTSSRDQILNRIRASLNSNVLSEMGDREQKVANRLKTHQANLIPELPEKTQESLFRNFKTFLESQGTIVLQSQDLNGVPDMVSDFLRQHNLAFKVRHGADALIEEIPWSLSGNGLQRQVGIAEPNDETSLSVAFAGIAETGTLVMLSGSDNPTTLNFLPENHIILLSQSRMVFSYEDVWQKMRETYGKHVMPRALSFISGPSRTADIEQTLIQGAHGPRRLCVIVVQNT